jgi:hypothetical protein
MSHIKGFAGNALRGACQPNRPPEVSLFAWDKKNVSFMSSNPIKQLEESFFLIKKGGGGD